MSAEWKTSDTQYFVTIYLFEDDLNNH